MQKETIVKLIVQVFAGLFGLFGVGFIVLGVHLVIFGISKGDTAYWLFLVFLPIGALLVLVAYQNIRTFSAKSIKSITALTVFMIWGYFVPYLEIFESATYEFGTNLEHLAILLIPLLLSYLLYSIISRVLIQYTVDEKKAEQP